VNEVGNVCLTANRCTTDTHVGLDAPTHLKKGLAVKTFKSESKSKSKSSKNRLKSGLESKSGFEYYKSVIWATLLPKIRGPKTSKNVSKFGKFHDFSGLQFPKVYSWEQTRRSYIKMECVCISIYGSVV